MFNKCVKLDRKTMDYGIQMHSLRCKLHIIVSFKIASIVMASVEPLESAFVLFWNCDILRLGIRAILQIN